MFVKIIRSFFNFLAAGKIIIAGGKGTTAFVKTVEVVDIVTSSNTCNNLPNLPLEFASELFLKGV